MEQLKKMYQLDKSRDKNNNLLKRLNLIALGNKIKANDLYQQINPIIDIHYFTYEKIEKVINIFSIYYPNSRNDVIMEYKSIIDFINENPINKFPNNINNLQNNYEIANELFELKTSKIFIIIFDLIKNKLNENNESDIRFVNETKKEFKKLGNLFDSENENSLNIKLLEEVLKKLDFDEIEKEVKILSNILKTNKKKINGITKNLNLLKNREKNLLLFKKIILLLNDFEFEKNELKETFEKFVEELNQISSIKILNEIDNS